MSDDKIIVKGGDACITYATTDFRWVRRRLKLDPFFFPDETITHVLQQKFQSSDGTQEWKDVPTVDET